MQAQQPKAVPSSATSAQAGSFGTLQMHTIQIEAHAYQLLAESHLCML